MKIALVHDWLVGYGGSERVLESFIKIYPEADIYTLVYDQKTLPDRFKHYKIQTTYLQKLPFSTKLYKNLVSFMPKAWEELDLTQYDLVLSSSSSCCKGIITRPDAIHICYCHTPTRYFWDMYYQYQKNAKLLKKLFMPSMIHKLRMWDRLAADRVDYFIANSNFVAQRIKKYYRRDAKVIYPCVNINDYPIVEQPEDYYLIVTRFVYYKRVDLAIQACNKLNKKLIVIGNSKGDEYKKLRKLAGKTIKFTGFISEEEMRNYYINAKAFLFPGEEDFGITPIEAQSAGVPVLAYGSGGALETVLDGKTGKFFPTQSVESLVTCMQDFEKKGVSFTRAQIREHSVQFSEERFRKQIAAFCDDKTAEILHR